MEAMSVPFSTMVKELERSVMLRWSKVQHSTVTRRSKSTHLSEKPKGMANLAASSCELARGAQGVAALWALRRRFRSHTLFRAQRLEISHWRCPRPRSRCLKPLLPTSTSLSHLLLVI